MCRIIVTKPEWCQGVAVKRDLLLTSLWPGYYPLLCGGEREVIDLWDGGIHYTEGKYSSCSLVCLDSNLENGY